MNLQLRLNQDFLISLSEFYYPSEYTPSGDPIFKYKGVFFIVDQRLYNLEDVCYGRVDEKFLPCG